MIAHNWVNRSRSKEAAQEVPNIQNFVASCGPPTYPLEKERKVKPFLAPPYIED